MEQLAIIVFILTISLTGRHLQRVYQVRKLKRIQFIKSYTLFLVFFCFSLVYDLFYRYCQINLNSMDASWGLKTLLFDRFNGCTITVVESFFLIISLHQLFGYRMKIEIKILYGFLFLLLIVEFLLPQRLFSFFKAGEYQTFLNYGLNWICRLSIIAAVLSFISKREKKISPMNKQKIILAMIIVSCFVFSILLDILFFTIPLPGSVYYLVVSLLYFTFFIMIDFFLIRYVNINYQSTQAIAIRFSKSLITENPLVQQRNITNREQEIIHLILQGMSNQEISDELYITAQSVRDHNYRIFKKLEINNRMQLSQLFITL